MGSLFALPMIAVTLLVIGLVVFKISLYFLPPAGAVRMAIAAPIAGAIGFAAGGAFLSLFFPKTLTSTAQVMTFLGGSVATGVISAATIGWIIWRLYRS